MFNPSKFQLEDYQASFQEEKTEWFLVTEKVLRYE